MNKQKIITKTLNWLKENNLQINTQDLERPWGAFWHISKSSLPHFLSLFFNKVAISNHNLSPKILLVESNKNLSLQFHHKRSEKWKVIKGPVKVILGKEKFILNKNEEININSETENKPRLILITFASTKRSQWSKYRRYA
jgi:mannose-6-phosphate isomerase-like protein (cupin superfamily)